MRKVIGNLYGLDVVSDPNCPPNNAYLTPEMEVIVPEGQEITKTIKEFVRANKDKILQTEFDNKPTTRR